MKKLFTTLICSLLFCAVVFSQNKMEADNNSLKLSKGKIKPLIIPNTSGIPLVNNTQQFLISSQLSTNNTNGNPNILASPIKRSLLSGDSCCDGSSWSIVNYSGTGTSIPVSGSIFPNATISIPQNTYLSIATSFNCSPGCTSSYSSIDYTIPGLGIIASSTGSFSFNTIGLFQVNMNGYCDGNLCSTFTFFIDVRCELCPPGNWGPSIYEPTTGNNSLINCGLTYNAVLNVPLVIYSSYICSGVDCYPTVHSNIYSSGNYISGGVGPSFNFTPTLPGCYTVNMDGNCGNNSCPPSPTDFCSFTINVPNTDICDTCYIRKITAFNNTFKETDTLNCGDTLTIDCNTGFIFNGISNCDSLGCYTDIQYQFGTTLIAPTPFILPSNLTAGVYPLTLSSYTFGCDRTKLDSCTVYIKINDTLCKNSPCGDSDFESGVLSLTDFNYSYGTVGALAPGLTTTSSTYELPFTCMSCSGTPIPSLQVHHRIESIGDDLVVGALLPKVHSGNHSMRLGNAAVNVGSEAVDKIFTVTAANSTFSFWYALVMGVPDVSTHACGIPTFVVQVTDISIPGSPVSYNSLVNLSSGLNYISSADPILSTTTTYPNPCMDPYTEPMAYKPWTYIQLNLASLIGKNVKIELITQDCGCCGHFCYAYLDGFCSAVDSNKAGSVELALADSCGVNGHICVSYNLPFNATATGTIQTNLNIYQNGNPTPVAIISSPVLTSGTSYCFNISSLPTSILTGLPNYFDYTINSNFTLSSITLPPQIIGVTSTGIDGITNNDYHIRCTACTPNSSVFDTLVCGSIKWGEQLFSVSGTYIDTFTNQNGCDSIVTLHLAIFNADTTYHTQIACDSFSWFGTTYFSSGVYNYHISSPLICDSIYILDLTINHSVTLYDTVTACTSFTWFGTSYSSSGDYVYTLPTPLNCDTVWNLHLIISNNISIALTGPDTICGGSTVTWCVTGCSSCNYVLSNSCNSIVSNLNSTNNCTTQTVGYPCTPTNCISTIVATDTITGCQDTITKTITILPKPKFVSISVIEPTCTLKGCILVQMKNCNNCGYVFSVDGGPFMSHGINPDFCGLAAGSHTIVAMFDHACSMKVCNDTIMAVVTLTPPIGSTVINLYDTACNNYTWYGNVLDTTGVYTHTLPNSSGCDTLVNLYLVIDKADTLYKTTTACDSFTWFGTSYYSSGIYNHHIPNSKLCDSVYILNLTINHSLVINFYDTICVGKTDTLPNGGIVSIAGIYSDTLHTNAGCDSILVTHLYVDSHCGCICSDTFCCDSFLNYLRYKTITTNFVTVNTAQFTPPVLLTTDIVQWDFNCDGIIDSSTTGNSSVLHTYLGLGTYTACATILRVQGGDTCWAVLTKAVTITKGCICDSSFASNVAAGFAVSSLGTTVTFVPVALTNCDTIKWDFGDGSASVTSVGNASVSHTYVTSNTYYVCMVVTRAGSANCYQKYCRKVTVTQCICDTSFASNVAAGFAVSSVGTTVTYVPVALTNCDTISWNFGDGSASVSSVGNASVSHTYVTSNTYNVCMVVTRAGSANCYQKYCRKVTVTQCICDSSFASNVAAGFAVSSVGTTVTYVPVALTNCDTISWNFGDGSASVTSVGNASVSHTYGTSNTYYVCMVVTRAGSANCYQKYCRKVTVKPCVCDTSFAGNVAAGFATSIVGTTVTFVPVALNNCDTIEWDFGDGTGAFVSVGNASIVHTYSSLNTYGICMKVIRAGSINCVKTFCKKITVSGIEEVMLANLKIYPNPANDFITIDAKDVSQTIISSFSLHDITGRKVLAENWKQEPTQQINISNFANGVYILSIENKEGKVLNNYRIVKY